MSTRDWISEKSEEGGGEGEGGEAYYPLLDCGLEAIYTMVFQGMKNQDYALKISSFFS